MTSTNGIGYDIQIYSEELGWLATSTTPYPDQHAATVALSLIPPDGEVRRVYEALPPPYRRPALPLPP